MVPLKNSKRALACLLAILMLLLAFAPGFALADDDKTTETALDTSDESAFSPLVFSDAGTPPKEVADVFGDISPNLRLEAYPVYVGHIGKPEWWKFTLYGTENLLADMKEQLSVKDAPYAFRYVMEIQGEQSFNFEGNVSYGKNRGDSFPNVTRFNMVIHADDYRYQDNIHCKRSADNQLSWLVEMPRYVHFNIDKVQGYRFHIYSAENRQQGLEYEFNPKIETDTALYTPIRRGGALKIDMPDPLNMQLTILDPRIPDGFTNSTVKKGFVKPYWHFKVVLSALEWFEVILDGTHGEPMDNMKFYCGHYLRKLDDSNKYSPRSDVIETNVDCSYAINGDQIAFTLKYPDDRPVDFTYIDYILLDMNNGSLLRFNQYPMF